MNFELVTGILESHHGFATPEVADLLLANLETLNLLYRFGAKEVYFFGSLTTVNGYDGGYLRLKKQPWGWAKEWAHPNWRIRLQPFNGEYALVV